MVINIREMPHHPAQYLLPWYLNGTLDEADTALVEAHLAACPECRSELDAELGLAAQLTSLAHQEDRDTGRAPIRTRPLQPSLRFLRRRVALGWVLAGQAAAAALLLAIFVPRASEPEGPAYHVLRSGQAERSGNMIVLFAPDAREQSVRKALSEAGARVVDGPTASGAYLLHVAQQRRSAALERLRADPQVALAEPIGGDRN